ncbi:energy transducer TonB [Rhizobiaceae bacterium BDR2-2]|uniref:Energy transducer TonB n=1 Tax=Ectorhizobium quercum TaxID=2965071 RepID=A0AAE3MZC7_9HYPH|nr:energy transducer TonB [Ectorhizobium quercum]MCX8995972.1 energy transducer TonB [Ectorhizobium quercum]
MNTLHNGTSRGVRAAETVLWTSAAMITLTLHVGAAAWLIYERPAEPVEADAPAAIMIEMAAEPEAINTEDDQVSPDQETVAESQPVEEQETPVEEPPEEIVETEPEPVEEVAEAEPQETEPEPVEEIVEEEIEPVEEQVAELENVEVPIPVARPRPPEEKPKVERPREIVKKEEPKKQVEERRKRPQPASQAAVESKARAKQSNRNAARESSSGGLFSSSASPARWKSRLMAHIERRKKYPGGARSRGERGVVHIRFRIDDSGNVLSASLVRSSGFSELDNEVLSLVRRASPVPAPPPGASKTITVPIRFDKG